MPHKSCGGQRTGNGSLIVDFTMWFLRLERKLPGMLAAYLPVSSLDSSFISATGFPCAQIFNVGAVCGDSLIFYFLNSLYL